MGNAFDKIAKPKAEAATKKTPKIAAKVTDVVKKAVDKLISVKAQLSQLETEKDQTEVVIISHVRPQQDEAARLGNFSKSFEVSGEVGSLLYNTSDKFSVPKDEGAQEELKKLIGAKRFETFFQNKRVVALRPEVLANDELVNKIVAALEKEGIENIFDVTDQLVAKKDLDRMQYELDQATLEKFRALCPQAKPALK